MTQMSAQQRFASVRARLMELELWDADSLVMTAPGAVCSAAGEPVEAALFSAVSAPMAVLTAGRYAREFAKDPHALCAETDDAAQMFGVRVPVRSAPRRGDSACIIPGTGFIVTARFENELIAACILLEKLSMTALLSHRIGTPKPLGAPLCLMEHAVYTKKYSRPSLAAAQGEEPERKAQEVPDLALRESVIAYGRKLVENRLIQATWGNVSARIDENRFLITPSGVDYDRIRPEDIVEISFAGGMTNTNYYVELKQGRYILRLPGRMTESLINRENEERNAKIASDLGFNCRLVYSNAATGIKVSEYIDGAETLNPRTARLEGNIRRTADILRRVHQSEMPLKNRFDPFEES